MANGKLSTNILVRILARTERARARGFWTLQSYANYGVEYYDLIPRKRYLISV